MKHPTIAAAALAVLVALSGCKLPVEETADEDANANATYATLAEFVIGVFGAGATVSDSVAGKGAFTFNAADQAMVITAAAGTELWAEVIYSPVGIHATYTGFSFDYKSNLAATVFIQDTQDVFISSVTGWGALSSSATAWASASFKFADFTDQNWVTGTTAGFNKAACLKLMVQLATAVGSTNTISIKNFKFTTN